MDNMLSLDSLAIAINAAHERCQRSYVTMLADARSTGELLLQAKSQLPHGHWSKWLTSNCAFSDRTAQRYMQIANSWDSLQSKTATVADLGVRMACEMIAGDRQLDKQDMPSNTFKSPSPQDKTQGTTTKKPDIRPGDRIKVTDRESPEYGQSLTVSEVVQDAIALCQKGNETYPLLINQVEVLERPTPDVVQDIKPIKDLEAQPDRQHGGNRNPETTKGLRPLHRLQQLLPGGNLQESLQAPGWNIQENSGSLMADNAFPSEDAIRQSNTMPPLSHAKSKREVTVAALQELLRRILDECEEYLPQELIDEARELL